MDYYNEDNLGNRPHAAANVGWRRLFRIRGRRHWSGVAELTSEVIRQEKGSKAAVCAEQILSSQPRQPWGLSPKAKTRPEVYRGDAH